MILAKTAASIFVKRATDPSRTVFLVLHDLF